MRNSASTAHSGSRRLSAPSRAARARVWNPSIQVCDVAMTSITAKRLLCSLIQLLAFTGAIDSNLRLGKCPGEVNVPAPAIPFGVSTRARPGLASDEVRLALFHERAATL